MIFFRAQVCRTAVSLVRTCALVPQSNSGYPISRSTRPFSDDAAPDFYHESLTEENNERDDYLELRSKYLQTVNLGHQVVLVQPFLRNNQPAGNDQLKLEESRALVETLNWRVVDSIRIGLNSFKKKELFGEGKLKELEALIGKDSSITAVFISMYQLTAPQRISLEARFQLPVIDRYSLVLQIFHQHARTREARLQVALAEIPYMKNRLNVDYHRDQAAKLSKGNLGENVFDKRRFVLKKLESRLRKQIEKIREQRVILRRTKQRSKIATVAVIGYTNAGKTSIIKALTGGADLKPRNQLFATLDVTAHQGRLPSSLKCLYLDTVGFISDIPTPLIASFSATLEDAMEADLLLHVRDVSHPDTVNQDRQVMSTLSGLKVSLKRRNLITVGNKIDLVSPDLIATFKKDDIIPVSALQSLGLDYLKRRIEAILIGVTNRQEYVYRVRTGSEEHEWLNKHAVVLSATVDDDLNHSKVRVLLTSEDVGKFKAEFMMNW